LIEASRTPGATGLGAASAEQVPHLPTGTLKRLAPESFFLPGAVPRPILRLPKEKFVPFHIDPRPAKRYPLHSQTKALFGAILSRKFDCATRPEDAVPGQTLNTLQDAHNLPRRSRPARSLGNGSVARNLSRGQSANTARDASPPILQHTFAGLDLAGLILVRFGSRSSLHRSIFHRQSAADKRNLTIVLT
jgi:hypothetical protein